LDKTTQLVSTSVIIFFFASILFVFQGPTRRSVLAIGQQDEQHQTHDPSIAINPNASSHLDEEANALNTIFKQTEKSLVTISRTLPSPTVVTPETQNVTVLGSGFLYDSQGHIITNDHVIGSAKIVNILFENGNRYTAKVVGGDMLNDIAVLKIIENFTQRQPIILPNPLVIGNSSNVKIGQTVIAVGSPFGLEDTMTSGIVSQVGRLIPESSPVQHFVRLHFPWVAYSIPDAIQTDAAINPGNSGGPLLNLQGQVIGINTAIVGNSNGIGFAIPSNAISRIVPTLIAKGNYTHPYLGLALDTSPSAIAEDYKNVPQSLKGVFVNAIEKGGPADKAGIHGSSIDQYYQRHSGDMIIAVDGHNVTKAEDFISYLDQHKTAGDSLNLSVYRAGKILSLVANLKPWPSLGPYIRQATPSSNPE
jgi:S1-C subfamily serine protease